MEVFLTFFATIFLFFVFIIIKRIVEYIDYRNNIKLLKEREKEENDNSKRL